VLQFVDAEVSGLIEYIDVHRGSGFKRKWKVDYDNLPSGLQEKLLGLDGGQSKRIKIDDEDADITWNDFRQYIVDKSTGNTEEDNGKGKPKKKSN
jgi:hypothetical protein